jgi:hypothetical protein
MEILHFQLVYSRLQKTPEELKVEKQRLRNLNAARKEEAAAERAQKVANEKAELAKFQRQDRKDRKTAALLYNKHYKVEFEKKERQGQNVKHQKVNVLTDQLDSNFRAINMLTLSEHQEWEEVFKLADAGDKVRKKEVEEVRMKNEMKQLMYLPAVWMEGDEPNEDDKEDKEEEEEEERPTKKHSSLWRKPTLWDTPTI